MVSLRTMRFSQWKKSDWICEDLTWNLSRNLTKIKGLSDTIKVVVGTLMCFFISVSKFNVTSKRSPTILEIHNSKLVNLIFLFKRKIRNLSYIFGYFIVILWPFGQKKFTGSYEYSLELRFKNILMISIISWCAI